MSRARTTLATTLRNTAEPESRATVLAKRPKTRANTKLIAGHFDTAASKQLRTLAVEEETTVQELLREALNDLFAKRGKATIA